VLNAVLFMLIGVNRPWSWPFPSRHGVGPGFARDIPIALAGALDFGRGGR